MYKDYEIWTVKDSLLVGFIKEANMIHTEKAYLFYHEGNPIHTVYLAKDAVIVCEVND